MTALKARDVDNFISRPDFAFSVFFIYGPDSGLVAERADAIAKKSGVDLKDPFNLIRLSADEATADPLRIADEANTIGMFGGKRLIRISGHSPRDLFKCLKPVLDAPPQEAWVIVEAGNLDTRSALRKNIEKHKSAIAIPCFQDNATALEKLIDEEIISNGMSMDRQVREELRGLLGENRMLSRNELKKLAIYSEGRTTVTLEDVRAMVGDGSAMVLTEIADAAATGNAAKLQTLLPRAVEAGNRPDMILQNCLKHFQTLQSLQTEAENRRGDVSGAIASARPPIHFSRKDAFATALRVWSVDHLSRAQKRLNAMMLEARKNQPLSASIAGTALLALALEAENRKRR